MAKTEGTTKEQRVQALLDSGAVRLYPGRGYAEVIGSRGTLYRVTKQGGCSCPNGLSRDPRSCYHAAACRELCAEYRALSAQARRGEKVRLSAALLKALGGVRVETPSPVPAGADRDERGIVYCLRCGSTLTPDGRCPTQDARLRELGYLEAA